MIDWSRPIENDCGPCKLLHKLKNDLNPNYVVLSLSETGREVCLEFNENGHSMFPDYALRNAVKEEEVFLPFDILNIAKEPLHHRIVHDFTHSTADEISKPYAIKLTVRDDKPYSVELLTLPKDPK